MHFRRWNRWYFCSFVFSGWKCSAEKASKPFICIRIDLKFLLNPRTSNTFWCRTGDGEVTRADPVNTFCNAFYTQWNINVNLYRSWYQCEFFHVHLRFFFVYFRSEASIDMSVSMCRILNLFSYSFRCEQSVQRSEEWFQSWCFEKTCQSCLRRFGCADYQTEKPQFQLLQCYSKYLKQETLCFLMADYFRNSREVFWLRNFVPNIIEYISTKSFFLFKAKNNSMKYFFFLYFPFPEPE